jgi:precorrin-3B methylase
VKKLRGLSYKEAAQDITKRLSNIRKVLLTEFKVEEILQEELVIKFYNLTEDTQRHILKENWTVFSKRIAE